MFDFHIVAICALVMYFIYAERKTALISLIYQGTYQQGFDMSPFLVNELSHQPFYSSATYYLNSVIVSLYGCS